MLQYVVNVLTCMLIQVLRHINIMNAAVYAVNVLTCVLIKVLRHINIMNAVVYCDEQRRLYASLLLLLFFPVKVEFKTPFIQQSYTYIHYNTPYYVKYIYICTKLNQNKTKVSTIRCSKLMVSIIQQRT